MKKADFKRLVDRYLQGEATQEETDLLFKYYDTIQENGTDWDDTEMGERQLVHDVLYPRILKDIKLRGKVRSYTWIKLVAAVVIVLSFITYFTNTEKMNQELVGKSEHDIPPGQNVAILTLADGSNIPLSELKNGDVLSQAGLRITKTAKGQLVYEVLNASQNDNSINAVNTITTPKGGQFQIMLPDGTKVWLNAASSLKYPVIFDESERKVELTGEAYFEVAKAMIKGKELQNRQGGRLPFKVKIKTTAGEVGEVEVLGTHFNIMAYEDEKEISTTLLEGSVKIKRGVKSKLLIPGQQSRLVKENEEISIIDDVNLDEVIAWKNERFEFNSVDIATILRQIGRWYNVEVVIEGHLPAEQFRGKISRNEPMSKVLKVLKLNGVNIKTEGRKIIVKP